MDIQMLGTGNAFAKTYYNNNALIYAGDRTLMVDCGTTAPAALHKLDKTFADIDAVLVTHIHADHIGGLEEFAFTMRFVYGRKPVLYISELLVERLWEHSLKGGLQQDGYESLDDYFHVRPLSEGVQHELLPGIAVELIRTRHIPNKISYSLLFNGEFYYSADSVFERELLLSLVRERGVRTIFHDCQLHPPGEVHASLPELLTLPDEVQEKVYLMHYGDDKSEFIGRTGRMTFVEQHRKYTI